MYLVHFGRSPAAATAAAAATVPVPQARRRAVPSIGTEASESCNLPRALTLGAAAAAAVVAAACCCLSCFSYFQITNFKIQFSNLQFIAAQVKQTEFCSQFIIYEFILNPYTEFHFVSLVSACRASVSRCSHHTLFSPLLSSLFLVSLFVVIASFVVAGRAVTLSVSSTDSASDHPPRSSGSTPSISEKYEIYRDIIH